MSRVAGGLARRSAWLHDEPMDFITRQQTRRDIVALELPQIVLDDFDEQTLPYNLDLQFHYPYPGLSMGPDAARASTDG
jgi:hypothetical protein